MFLNKILNRKSEADRSLNRGKNSDNDGKDPNPTEGFLCPTCFLAFPTAEQLQNHYESTHAEDSSSTFADDAIKCPPSKIKPGSANEFSPDYLRNVSRADKADLQILQSQIESLDHEKKMMLMEIDTYREQIKECEQEIIKSEKRWSEQEAYANKLVEDMSKRQAEVEELVARNQALGLELRDVKRRNRDLEIEIDQRPSADDVFVLKQEIVSVQRMMDQAVLKLEEEKVKLEKQNADLKTHCIKLEKENEELDNLCKSRPKKEHLDCLQLKIKELGEQISVLTEDSKVKRDKIIMFEEELDRCKNYDEIVEQLRTTMTKLEALQRRQDEREKEIEKLKLELKQKKDELHQIKLDRSKLFAKIEEGEGASAAMVQLKEENIRLQEQIMHQQTAYSKDMVNIQQKLENLHLEHDGVKFELDNSLKLNKKFAATLPLLKKELTHLSVIKNKLVSYTLEERNDYNGYSKEITAALENVRHVDKNLNENLQAAYDFIESISVNLQSILNGVDERMLQFESKELKAHTSELLAILPLVKATVNRGRHVENLELEILSLKQGLKLKEEEIASLTQSLQRSEANIEETKEMLTNAVNAAAGHEAVLQECLQKLQYEKEKSLRIQQQQRENEEKISELHLTVEMFKESREELRNKVVELDSKAKDLTSSNEILNRKKISLSEELVSTKVALDEKETFIQNLQSSLSEMKVKYEEAEDAKQKVLSDLSNAKQLLINQNVQYRKDVDAITDQHSKELKQLKKEISDLELEVNDLKSTNSSMLCEIEEMRSLSEQRSEDWEKCIAHYTAQISVLTENSQILKDDLQTERNRRQQAEQQLDEISGIKLELDAKLENALEERRALLDRCLKSETENEKLLQNNADLRRKLDDSIAALQELGRENQALQVENMKHLGRKWADDAEVTHCTACGKNFSVTIRKHHCRNCGNIFCNECSSKTAAVASSKKPVRVCALCFGELSK